MYNYSFVGRVHIHLCMCCLADPAPFWQCQMFNLTHEFNLTYEYKYKSQKLNSLLLKHE